MVWLAVTRYAGDRRAAPIIDPLIVTDAVAINRGRNALDKLAHRPSIVRVQATYRDGVRLGMVVEVRDELQGISWKGKIVGLSYSNASGGPEVSLDIERPTLNVEYLP